MSAIRKIDQRGFFIGGLAITADFEAAGFKRWNTWLAARSAA